MPAIRLRARRRGMIALACALTTGAVGAATASGAPAPGRSGSGGRPAQAVPVAAAYPSPGTKAASPRTQISFRGVAPAQLGALRVTGSRTGPHPGRLAPHSDGRGASFVPDRAFASGERVTVGAGVTIAGATGPSYSFRTARFLPNPPLTRRLGRTSAAGTMHLATRPDLRPPLWQVRALQAGATNAAIFAGPKLLATRNGRQGAQILSPTGQTRLWLPLPLAQKAADVRAQLYRGRPAMTFWQGYLSIGQGSGEGVILDSSYRVLQRVRAANGYTMDLHEFRLTPQGTALLIAYQAVEYDLRPVGGPRNGRVTDAVVQEIDLPTGLVVFEWHSLGNVGLRESDWRRPPAGMPWDYFHANAVSPDGDEGIVVSARHTSAVYRIHRSTGAIDWRLGGRRSDFRPGPGATFARQHDAEIQPDGTVRLFDNSLRTGRGRSRAITLWLDRAARTATLVRSADRADRLFAGTQGNAQALPGGATFVDWGSKGVISEIDAAGRTVFDAWLPPGWDTYRAYRAEWIGTPVTRPRVAVRSAAAGQARVYASWNGSTEVRGWRVLAGPSAAALQAVAETPWRELETSVVVPSAGPFFAVEAVDGFGKVIGTSGAVRLR